MYLVVLLFFLIFLVFWIINVWFGFDVVKLCVFYVFVFGLDVFIGYWIGMVVDIFVEVKYYVDLWMDFYFFVFCIWLWFLLFS